MQHDLRLRAAARVIYEAVYPGEEWTPCPFDEAERLGDLHYRQALDAALSARNEFVGQDEQLSLMLPL